MLRNGKFSEKLRNVKKHLPGVRQRSFQAVFILMQLGLLAAWFLLSGRYLTYFYLMCEFLSLCVVMHIVREDSNPSHKIPWIIVNLTVPVLGGLSYLMFGKVRFSREERRRLKGIEFRFAEVYFEQKDALTEFRQKHPQVEPQVEYIRNIATAPLHKNTAVEYYPSGEEMFPRMLDDLRSAEKFIFMEYFIIHSGLMWDTVEEILIQKASEGVEVRIMYDSIGSFGLVPHDYVSYLAGKGIQVCEFNKLTNIFSSRFNNRDHRKICVVDGRIGYTGGINMADEYINHVERFGYWKDTAVRLEGSAVRNLTIMFLSLWEFMMRTTSDYRDYVEEVGVDGPGYVQPYTDSPFDGEHIGETVYRNILSRACNYAYITTPYLIIDDELITALTVAAKSGVDVRIITPGIPDKQVAYALTRSYYEVLLRSGVRIYEYTPGFMHAKMFVSDDNCAVVGTINLDYRSLCHHFEDAVWMYDVPVIHDIKTDIMECFECSKEITLDMCRRKNVFYRLWLSLLRFLAPLF